MSDFDADIKLSHALRLVSASSLPNPEVIFHRLKLALENPVLVNYNEAFNIIAEIFIAGVYAEIKFEAEHPNRLRLK